jgi:hypothetical protein
VGVAEFIRADIEAKFAEVRRHWASHPVLGRLPLTLSNYGPHGFPCPHAYVIVHPIHERGRSSLVFTVWGHDESKLNALREPFHELFSVNPLVYDGVPMQTRWSAYFQVLTLPQTYADDDGVVPYVLSTECRLTVPAAPSNLR